MLSVTKIALYTDNTLPVALEGLCNFLNDLCRKAMFTAGKTTLRIGTPFLSFPSSYENLPNGFLRDTEPFDMVFICTNIPYENNYFFESDRKHVLISFYGWNILTDLSVSNGLVYFIAVLLCDIWSMGVTHDEITGCLNDFRWNKKSIDLGMRAAFLCGECQNKYTGDRTLLEDVQRLLDAVSAASRLGKDILEMSPTILHQGLAAFDVFLCHNSEDKPLIREMNDSFKASGVTTWFDEDQSPPGVPWQSELEKQIQNVRNACVFVGDNGIGPWQNAEIRAFLSEFANRACPVIPVILPGSKNVPELPLFLRQMTWVDLRQRSQYDKNISKLVEALRRR